MELPYDPEHAVETLSLSDPILAGLIHRVGPFRLTPRSDEPPFHALARSIVYQQLSGKAAATIFGRILDLFPDDHLDPEHLLTLPDEHLRRAGLSRSKTAALKDLAAKTLDGVVPERSVLEAMDDEAIIERLTVVRGVGRWTAEMLLIFYLCRPDVLPLTDLGVRKGFMVAYGLETLPAPQDLSTHGERWRPYRSVASWYLWRILDTKLPANTA